MDREYTGSMQKRCIQDCPPACTAVCPSHVDVRGMIAAVRNGKYDEAAGLYSSKIIFPGIISRICERPCETECLRSGLGGAIGIRGIEASVWMHGRAPSIKKRPRGSRQERIAVIGAGLSGLAAAVTLADKGYSVVVYEKEAEPGGRLHEAFAADCGGADKGIVDRDFRILEMDRIEINTGTFIRNEEITRLLSSFDAVYLAAGSAFPEISAHGAPFYTTSVQGIFAGGTMLHDSYKPHLAMNDGRRAAVSIDRSLKGVSLSEGRENEGPQKSCLTVKTEGIAFKEGSIGTFGSGIPDKSGAEEEAARCLMCECMQCAEACRMLAHWGSYPKEYIREISNGVNQVYGVRKVKHLINSCTGCGTCAEVCPNELSMADICMTARTELVERGIMPPAIHEFPIRDMEFSCSPEASLLARASEGVAAGNIYFPGCQMQALMPDHLERSWRDLVDLLDGDADIFLGCCGAPAESAGKKAAADEAAGIFISEWEKSGKPRIICGCVSCMASLEKRVGRQHLVSVWEIFSEKGYCGNCSDAVLTAGSGSFAASDPCTAGKFPEAAAAVRRITGMLGIRLTEPGYSEGKGSCCGFGGLVSFAEPEIAEEMRRRRIDSARGSVLLVYCAVCGDGYGSSGGKARHLFDLMYGKSVYPADDGRPMGFSRRQENRIRCRRRIASEWFPENPPAEKEPSLRLEFADGVRELLERRMILERDLLKLVTEAERSGRRILNPSTGSRFASYRPGVITYWAEYTEEDGVYTILSAYSHRLEVKP